MDEPSSNRPAAPEPAGPGSIPKILGWVLRTAAVLFGAAVVAVGVALLVDDSAAPIHLLHRLAAIIRPVLMALLMALAAYVAFCNACLLRDNLRNKASHSLIPILGLAFGAAAWLAAPAGSPWRWLAIGVTLADTGTWLTVWATVSLLRQAVRPRRHRPR